MCTFDIIAIAEFGSGTFGQTGTNTVTLFLRKKQTNPVLDDHYKNRIQSWFHNDTRKDIVFEDYHLFEAYCAHIGVKPEDYKTLFTYTADWKKALGSYEIFKEYIPEFSNDAKAKAIQKKKISGKYTKEMQNDELERHIYYSVCQIEQEKLLFFCLAMTNGQEVVVIRSPAATKESEYLYPLCSFSFIPITINIPTEIIAEITARINVLSAKLPQAAPLLDIFVISKIPDIIFILSPTASVVLILYFTI